MSIRQEACVVDCGAELLRKVDWVAQAVSSEEHRYAMKGVFVDGEGDGMRIVATDGQRLHVSEICAADAMEMPKPGLYRVHRLSESAFVFASMDGTYPNWRAVIPSVGLTTATGIIRSERAETAMYRLWKSLNFPIKYQHIESLVQFGGDWVCAYKDAYSQIIFRDTTGETAVIMPMKENT